MSISSELERIMAGKAAIASAIEDKGVTVPEGAKIDEMPALVRSISGGGGGGNADWNAAEGEPGHVLNRTHYEERRVAVIFPEMTADASGGEVPFATKWEYYPAAGIICDVVYNGVTYKCPATPMDFSYVAPGAEVMIVGNLSAVDVGDDTGEPFCIMICNEAAVIGMGVYGALIPLDGSATVTVSVGVNSEYVHKLDGKYLPDGLPYEYTAIDNMVADVSLLASQLKDFQGDGEFKWYIDKEDENAIRMPQSGNRLIVYWNQQRYECAGYFLGDGTYALFGDKSLFMKEFAKTDEPFCIMFMQSSVSVVTMDVRPKNTAEDVILTVDLEHPVVKTMDEKFIPDLSQLILLSPNGTRYQITVDDSGALTATAVT